MFRSVLEARLNERVKERGHTHTLTITVILYRAYSARINLLDATFHNFTHYALIHQTTAVLSFHS